jgi:hypothetical protein
MSKPPNLSAEEQKEIVHAINIHGVFFERWCLQAISNLPNWQITQFKHPVEYPAYKGEKTELDIQAEMTRGDVRLVLCIECKKNNPEFTNWVFFNVPAILKLSPTRVFRALTDRVQPTGGLVPLNFAMPLVDECRETKSPYKPKGSNPSKKEEQTKTKTANDSIQAAAKQIALSTQNAIMNVLNDAYARYIGNRSSGQQAHTSKREIVIPVIVTTARIYTCDFDPKEIDAVTGEIPDDRATLTEQPYVAFINPLLPRLEVRSNVSNPGAILVDTYYRLDIVVVNSNSLTKLLGDLDSGLDSLIQ